MTAGGRTTFTVDCPCCGELVTGTDAGFSATTVEIAACTTRRAAGVVSDTVRKSAGYGAAMKVAVDEIAGYVSLG